MYIPAAFAEARVDVLQDLIRSEPFGALVVLGPNGLDANHVPFELDPDPAPFGTLRCHVARANPVWREHSADTDALVMFQGTHTYVSPSWYPSKAEHGKVVPTWNYVVVHARGPLRVIDDRSWLRQLIERLTDHHEAGRSDRWKVSDAPSDFVDTMVNAIVGIEIPVRELTGKWKVSQNRSAEDRAGVVARLTRQPSDSAVAMAQLVKRAK